MITLAAKTLAAALVFGASAVFAAAPITIPYSTRDGRILLPARVNGTGPLNLLLDTGYELIMLNPQHTETLGLRRAGGITIVGIAGEERADMFAGANFDFGGAQFQPRRVASLPSDARRRRGRDGVLGSSFFKSFVVEIDPRAHQVRLHEPATFQYSGRGEIVPLSFTGDVPMIDTQLTLAGKTTAPARLKIDTGCDGGVCLGCEFVQSNSWGATNSTSLNTRSGVGGGARTHRAELAKVQLGKASTARIGADLFESVSPGGEGAAGHLGMEVLNRFKVVLDYAGKRLILEAYPAR